MKETQKNPVGRPTEYDAKKHCELVYNYCLLGATDEQLAEFLNICTATLYNWKNTYPDFLEAINSGKQNADAMVAKSLFHRALGYSHKEDDIRTCDNQVVITETTKHYPPDTTACIFWLKNRRRDQWRDKPLESEESEDTIESVTVNVKSAKKTRD